MRLTLRVVRVVILALLAAPLATEAQPAMKPVRVAFVAAAGPAAEMPQRPIARALVEALRERGWVEGKNLTLEYRSMEGRIEERAPVLFAELLALKVDVIVVSVNPVVKAAKRATSKVPIVMYAGADTVEDGLVASLARPDGNVTGVDQSPTPQVHQKLLELLNEAVPRLGRVAVLTGPHGPNPEVIRRYEREIGAAASTLWLALIWGEAKSVAGVPEAFESIARARIGVHQAQPQGLVITASPTLLAARWEIAELALTYRLLTIAQSREFAEAGTLMSYGANAAASARHAAVFVDKILKGAKPADLPVERPTKFELVINMRTAKALGLTIPPAMLARADEVIN